jgi:hypothetical protein
MIQMNYKPAHAAAMDEGNRHMRKNGRNVWTEDDYNACAEEFNRLWPEEREKEAILRGE